MEFAGVVFGCPLQKENKSCPFRYLHEMSSSVDRFKAWQSLEEKERRVLKYYHLRCKNEF